jgi:signal transduction histidine kinase
MSDNAGRARGDGPPIPPAPPAGDRIVTARGLVRQGLDFVRVAEPRVRPSRRAIATDFGFAAVVLAVAVIVERVMYGVPGHAIVLNATTGQSYLIGKNPGSIAGIPPTAILAAAVISVPLAVRRLAPLTSFAVLLLGAIATRQYATDVTFLAAICAGYSAVAHSRFRNAALLAVPFGGLVMTAGFWSASQALPPGRLPLSSRAELLWPGAKAGASGVTPPRPKILNEQGRLLSVHLDPWRGTVLIVLLALVAISVIRNAMRAGERRTQLEAEHAAATRRAVERERARIASELHDVVTHNVSVMIVQAGAARQVLAQAPGQATAAMLAVEASGRAAMTELRHLLGLLSPAGPGSDEGDGDGDADLRPQPGLAQLQSLVARVGGTGLPVELHIGDEVPAELPPGLDLAAFRVVQEGLTNVLKHAGKPRTSVSLDCRDGDLLVAVADVGPPIPAAVPAVPGGGRGLLGLRERVALYGGQLEAGPQPAGGWQVQARFPFDPPPAPAGRAPGRPEAAAGTGPVDAADLAAAATAR